MNHNNEGENLVGQRKQSLRNGTPSAKNRTGGSQQPTNLHTSAGKPGDVSNQKKEAFFVHRMSNSNANLKHIIKSYKEDNSNV